MTTIAILLIIYAAGVILSYFLTKFMINEYNTQDKPYVGALLSWITIFFVFAIILLEFIMHSAEEDDGNEN